MWIEQKLLALLGLFYLHMDTAYIDYDSVWITWLEHALYIHLFFLDPYIYPDVSTMGGNLLTDTVQEIFLQTKQQIAKELEIQGRVQEGGSDMIVLTQKLPLASLWSLCHI